MRAWCMSHVLMLAGFLATPAIGQVFDEAVAVVNVAVTTAAFPYTESGPNGVRTAEGPLGSMIADAMIWIATEANPDHVPPFVAILNGGSIRGGLPEGNVTNKDFAEMLPFAARLQVKNLTGQALVNSLANGVSTWAYNNTAEDDGRFPHVSGMRYSFNSAREILDVTVNDGTGVFVPVDLSGYYSVVSSDFLNVDGGGDGYTEIASAPRAANTAWPGPSLNVEIINYVRASSPISPPYDGRASRFIGTSDSEVAYMETGPEGVRTAENKIGNLFADSLVWFAMENYPDLTGTTVAIINGGSFRDALPEGNVYDFNVREIMPFVNTVEVKSLTGQELSDSLANGVSQWAYEFTGDGRFPHVSGMRFKFNAAREIVDVMVSDGGDGFVPLDLAASYNVVVPSFLTLDGIGDGYAALWAAPDAVNATGETVNDAAMQYIEATSPVSPSYDGRAARILGTSDSEVDYMETGPMGLRTAENMLGSFVADALVWCAKEDHPGLTGTTVAIINGGSFRAGMPEGALSDSDVREMLPFSNTVEVKSLTGQELRDSLVNGVSIWAYDNTAAEDGRFPHVSGMRFKFNAAREILSVMVSDGGDGFVPLDLAASYNVVVPSFLTLDGIGDGYAALWAAPDAAGFSSTGKTVNTAVMKYLETTSPVSLAYDGRAARILGTSDSEVAYMETGTMGLRTAESTIGSFVADALVWSAKQDHPGLTGITVAIINGGSFRAGMPEGDVTDSDVREMLPFSNTVEVKSLTGQELRDSLVNGVSIWAYDNTAAEDGRFPHVSGMRFTFNAAREILSVMVSDGGDGFAPLDLAASYNVVVPSFLTLDGIGDGYTALWAAPDAAGFSSNGETVNIAAMKYLEATSPVSHANDGRVARILGTSDSEVAYMETGPEGVRTAESKMGSIVADALVWSAKQNNPDLTGTTVAILNGGSFRAGMPEGDVSDFNLLQMLPFSNTVEVKSLTGQELKDSLANGVSQWAYDFTGDGRFPHVSGMRFKYNAAREIVDVMVSDGGDGFAPLDLAASYNVVVPSFLTLDGIGDGYAALWAAPDAAGSSSPGDDLTTAAMKYIEASPVSPAYDNRAGRLLGTSDSEVPYMETGPEGVRTAESKIGSLVADSLVWSAKQNNPDLTGTTVAILNGGSFRGGMPEGDVTDVDVLLMMPFSNTVEVKSLTGQELSDSLTNGVSQWAYDFTGDGRFPHVSGMRFKYNAAREILSVMVSDGGDGFAPLDLAASYNVVVPSFLTLDGIGDGYAALWAATAAAGSASPGGIVNTAVMKYIEATTPVTPVLDGRAERVLNAFSLGLPFRESGPGGVRSSETAIGNFLADAMVWGANGAPAASRRRLLQGGASPVEVAVLNGGGIRGPLPSGQVSDVDIRNAFPFTNALEVKTVSGAELARSIQHGVTTGDGAFPQVSGLSYNVQTDTKMITNLKVKVDGFMDDVKPDMMYNVALPSYLASGGDGYSDFGNAAPAAGHPTPGMDMIEVFSRYMDGGVRNVSPTVGGRIVEVAPRHQSRHIARPGDMEGSAKAGFLVGFVIVVFCFGCAVAGLLKVHGEVKDVKHRLHMEEI